MLGESSSSRHFMTIFTVLFNSSLPKTMSLDSASISPSSSPPLCISRKRNCFVVVQLLFLMLLILSLFPFSISPQVFLPLRLFVMSPLSLCVYHSCVLPFSPFSSSLSLSLPLSLALFSSFPNVTFQDCNINRGRQWKTDRSPLQIYS